MEVDVRGSSSTSSVSSCINVDTPRIASLAVPQGWIIIIIIDQLSLICETVNLNCYYIFVPTG